MTIGYAIKDRHGAIDLRTVGPTERGAKVNWLYVDRAIPITNLWTDTKIAMVFERESAKAGASCVKIMVTEVGDA